MNKWLFNNCILYFLDSLLPSYIFVILHFVSEALGKTRRIENQGKGKYFFHNSVGRHIVLKKRKSIVQKICNSLHISFNQQIETEHVVLY